jgi:hypothetical protein
MNGTNNVATDLFYKIRSRFSGLKLGNDLGMVTINPEEARFFDFDYIQEDQVVGHVSISLAEPNSMKVYFSSGITESMDSNQRKGWFMFLRELRSFAKRRLMSFDTRDIAKDNLDKRDYAFLSQNSKTKPEKEQPPVGESVMNESQLYGTKTVSYQKLMDTRLIIKHSHQLTDDMAPGARSRNIAALFVENQDGERFKYPFIHLAGARAMQRHVANGGLPYDDVGKSIIGMSEQIAQLKSFSNYVVRNDLMNSQNNSIIEQSQQALANLREQISKLSRQSYYENFKESFQSEEPIEVPIDVVEDFTERFTVKNFNENIKSVFPILYKLMQENNTVDYEDIVSMTTEIDNNDEAEVLESEEDDIENFEQWVLQLGEESAITSSDESTKTQAVKDLQELVGEHFPAGTDGTNAIESLKGIIEDPSLFKEIKDQAKEDPDGCVRPLVKAWLEDNAPEVVDQLDFGDMVDEPAAAQGGDQTAPEEEPQMAGDDPDERNKKDDKDDLPFEPDDKPPSAKDEFGNTIKHRARHLARKGMRQAMDVKEVAEFISSFYDRESGTFPKGPEGVCTMVGKKFGEQAEQVARKFVERMAPHQEAGAEQMQELARMRELAGMKNEAGVDPNQHPQSKDYGTGDDDSGEEDDIKEASGNYMWQEVGDEDDQRQLKRMAERLAKMYKHNAESSASDEEIMSVLDDVVREFVPQVGTLKNVVPVAQAFFDKLPIKEPEPEYDDDGEEMGPENDIKGDFIRDIWSMVKITAAAEKGDTSSYGYKVHPMMNKESAELEAIKRLSGIAKGIGF